MLDALAQGMQAQWHRHEVLANNLANVSTPGFKRDDLLIFPPGAPTPAGAAPLPGGDATVAQWLDLSQGPIRETGRDLDAALSGPGFFVVDTPGGERYTRAGGFDVGADGALVTSSGLRVLGEKGPIILRGGGRVTIGEKGEVREDGRAVDTLRVVAFSDTTRFVKEGNGLLAASDPAAGQPATTAQVIPGSLEGANVNSVEAMVSIIEVLRTYESCQRAIQAIDEVDRTANDLGRV